MKNKHVKIKVSWSELEALVQGYEYAVTQMEEERQTERYTEHEMLLLEHAMELHHWLKDQLERDQKSYTLNLNRPAARAFYYLWQRPFTQTTYSGNAVRKVYGLIDKEHKSATWIS